MKKRFFTLVELLVVAAILAILASVMLPTLSLARESAKRTVCLSNLGQIANAYAIYLNGNNNQFPKTPPNDGVTGSYPNGNGILYEKDVGYVAGGKLFSSGIMTSTDMRTFYCPGDSVNQYDNHSGDTTYFTTWTNLGKAGGVNNSQVYTQCSYWYQGAVGYVSQSNRGHLPNVQTDPSGTAIYADCFGGPGFNWTAPHAAGYNVLYLDGSASWFDDASHQYQQAWWWIRNVDYSSTALTGQRPVWEAFNR